MIITKSVKDTGNGQLNNLLKKKIPKREGGKWWQKEAGLPAATLRGCSARMRHDAGHQPPTVESKGRSRPSSGDPIPDKISSWYPSWQGKEREKKKTEEKGSKNVEAYAEGMPGGKRAVTDCGGNSGKSTFELASGNAQTVVQREVRR